MLGLALFLTGTNMNSRLWICASSFLFATLCSAQEGIRCASTHGRVNVSAKQWKTVSAAFRTHDVKRIAPFISKDGITETMVDFADLANWEKGWPKSRKESANSATKSKKQFLKDVSELKFYDDSGTVSTGAGTPGLVFAYLWIYLREKPKNQDLRSTHYRSDVWRLTGDFGGKDFGFGRVRFICEDGWLKVAEIKVHLPIDP